MVRFFKYLSIITVLAWVAGFCVYLHIMPKNVGNEYSNTDAIVVLTGGSGRISTGVSLLYQKKSDKLFISGVDSGTDVDMIVSAIDQQTGNNGDKNRFKNYLTNRVLMKRRIYLGYEARDTMGNALETAEWTYKEKVKSIRLVTSAYHMPRAMFYFKNIPEKLWENNKGKYSKLTTNSTIPADVKAKGVNVKKVTLSSQTVGLLYGSMGNVEIIPHPVFNKSINYDKWWSDYSTIKAFFTEYNKFIISAIYQLVVPNVKL